MSAQGDGEGVRPRIERLTRLLRPAAGGLYTVSTGRATQLALQKAIYGAADEVEVEVKWRATLETVPKARVALLGVPSDTGAGLARGAAFGPQALRAALLEARPGFAAWAARNGVVDVGDVPVVPQLLHDEMLSERQKEASRRALYAGLDPTQGGDLPVSPLSIAEAAVDDLLAVNPALQILALGGDHSVAWPVVAALARQQVEPWAIVHPDAHTDLLPERLGVRYCFATWAYHANELLGRGGRLVQVGIRASGRSKAHWEETLGVRQFWASEVEERGEAAVLDELLAHLHGLGVRRVYLSNDIDATDASLAPATGTPEPRGLSAGFVTSLIERLGATFEIIGADLVEVAPPIGAADESARTVSLGATYLLSTLEAMLRSPTPCR